MEGVSFHSESNNLCEGKTLLLTLHEVRAGHGECSVSGLGLLLVEGLLQDCLVCVWHIWHS